MKLFIILITTIFLFTNCSKKEIVKENDLSKLHLKGKVKSLKHIGYKAFMDGDSVATGSIEVDKAHYFNEDGFVMKLRQLDNSSFYSYDNTMKLLNIKEYYEDGNIRSTSKYNYDYFSGLLKNIDFNLYRHGIEKLSKSINQKFEYDDRGNILKEESSYPDGAKIDNTFYMYKDNVLVKDSANIYQGEELAFIITSNYKNGLKNEIFEYNALSQKKLTVKREIIYNEYGHNIEMLETDFQDSTTKLFKYDLNYDSTGNWIKVTESENGEPSFIAVRTIEYYK